MSWNLKGLGWQILSDILMLLLWIKMHVLLMYSLVVVLLLELLLVTIVSLSVVLVITTSMILVNILLLLLCTIVMLIVLWLLLLWRIESLSRLVTRSKWLYICTWTKDSGRRCVYRLELWYIRSCERNELWCLKIQISCTLSTITLLDTF